MTPERLQFIKNRLTKYPSAPDAADLGIELCRALEPHTAHDASANRDPSIAPAFTEPVAFKSTPTGEAVVATVIAPTTAPAVAAVEHFDGETGLRHDEPKAKTAAHHADEKSKGHHRK